MPKLKRLPNTKKQPKYLGPYTISEVTNSNVTISKEELGTNRDKKIPIHIVRPYFQRSAKPGERKRKSTDKASPDGKRTRIDSSQVRELEIIYILQYHMDSRGCLRNYM